MWLPETAVNLPTLEALVEHGLYVILSPYQALRVRPLAGGPWEQVEGPPWTPPRPTAAVAGRRREARKAAHRGLFL